MRVAIVYDDDAVYVGARMFSRDPSKIQAPLSRRDNTFQAERMWVSFDSYTTSARVLVRCLGIRGAGGLVPCVRR